MHTKLYKLLIIIKPNSNLNRPEVIYNGDIEKIESIRVEMFLTYATIIYIHIYIYISIKKLNFIFVLKVSCRTNDNHQQDKVYI